MKYILYTCSFVSVLLLSRCTTVYNGQVISETTGKPLKNVSVTLQNYNQVPSIIVDAITDNDGNFKLKIPFILRKYAKDEANVSLTCDGFQFVDFKLIRSNKSTIIKLKAK